MGCRLLPPTANILLLILVHISAGLRPLQFWVQNLLPCPFRLIRLPGLLFLTYSFLLLLSSASTCLSPLCLLQCFPLPSLSRVLFRLIQIVRHLIILLLVDLLFGVAGSFEVLLNRLIDRLHIVFYLQSLSDFFGEYDGLTVVDQAFDVVVFGLGGRASCVCGSARVVLIG